MYMCLFIICIGTAYVYIYIYICTYIYIYIYYICCCDPPAFFRLATRSTGIRMNASMSGSAYGSD